MTLMQGDPMRLYEPAECGPDRYPHAWHSVNGGPGVKHLVRDQADHRCVRCHHPYQQGAGEWSPCDRRCTHHGPIRARAAFDAIPWTELDNPPVPAGEFVDVLNGQWCEARWRILTVHHLRLGDDAKRDLRWWNLAALCQRCHLQIQGKVVMERIWPWPHTDWFRPYAAGWYAWSYLGEDLTRREVDARMEELLALEQIAGAA